MLKAIGPSRLLTAERLEVVPTASGAGRDGRLAIIAGRGFLPLYVAQAAQRAGENPFVITLAGEADADFAGIDHQVAAIGDARLIEQIVRREGIARVVLSGGVHRRPDWASIHPTLKVIFRLPSIVRTLVAGGDDAVLRMVIGIFEGMGCRVCGVHEIAPDLLANTGLLAGGGLSDQDRTDIQVGVQAAIALGKLDIGQGAVCVGGRVIALEGPEGTDAMLGRVAELRAAGRISQRRRGVLIKLSKPQQDLRADLPTIGPSTIYALAAAGLAGVAVEAGRSLIVERDSAMKLALEKNVFIGGIDLAVDGFGLS